MLDDRLRQRAALEGAYYAACDAVHQITGRSDQSVHQISAIHSDHDAVAAWREAKEKLDAFDREGQGK